MTLLRSITSNDVWLRCRCGHGRHIAVADVIEGRESWSLDDLVKAGRCSACGARGQIVERHISYVGRSDVAMDGAR